MKYFMNAFVLFLIIGCKNGDPQPTPLKNVDTINKVKSYFPVLDFIQSEIRYVDSLPVGIMRYRTQNGVTDSGYIKHEEFHALAQEFLPAELNRKTFENEFTENSFFDNTTQFSSFLYSTNNSNLSVHRVDVVVKPQDVVYNNVKSIYMEKLFERADTSIKQKLYWKAGQNFSITTEVRTTKLELPSSYVKVVWNPWE